MCYNTFRSAEICAFPRSQKNEGAEKMWVVFAFGSALFAGVTAILAKLGLRDMDSSLATALRTVVVLAFSWLMVYLAGLQEGLRHLDARAILFLALSGLATGASWLCYFRALQIGDINKVTPVDKSSTLLTILLAWMFLKEPITPITLAAMFLMGCGTYLMIRPNPPARAEKSPASEGRGSASWLVPAALSALFAALTSILGKIGMQGIDSTLGTALRTGVVLIMAWVIVFMQKKQSLIKKIDKKSWIFIGLSGLTTGLSWLCYYRALQDGKASIVVPIDKLSIVPTILFSYLFLKEKLSRAQLLGLAAIVGGTLVLLIK